MNLSEPGPTVEEVLRFEDVPPGELASRRAVVRWGDRTGGEALRWYGDEVRLCEGDLLGKSREQLRSLHFRRDRDLLQSERGASAAIKSLGCPPWGEDVARSEYLPVTPYRTEDPCLLVCAPRLPRPLRQPSC